MNNQSPNSRRAALRASQEAEAKKKRVNRILIAVAAVIGAIIIGIVAVVVVQQVGKTTGNGGTTTKGEQISPPNATSEFGVIPFKATLKEGAPKVVIWEDPQCPWCKRTYDQFGKQMHELAEKGEISLEYRMVNFLDSGRKNDASLRAVRGMNLADKYGKYTEYVGEVYANQPTREGNGFTDDLLRNQIPEKIGITGENLAEFQRLYDAKATDDFVEKTTRKSVEENVRGTPSFFANGKKFDLLLQDQTTGQLVPAATNAEDLLKYIKEKAVS